jgi:site-specific DNA recombinase
MGRLTLNMLLSFAQFEREIAGERIRDKIKASKAKGMWMGGTVPLGYDAIDKQLIVNAAEAETVCRIFELYLEFGSVRRLTERLAALGIVSKRRAHATGRISGGKPFQRGALYHLLSNRIYIGEIAHRGEVHQGRHDAIIDPATWGAAQARLASNRHERGLRKNAKAPSLLAGLVFDAEGQPLTPTHANKGGRRYRYYVSAALIRGPKDATGNGMRIPASELEGLVTDRLLEFLNSSMELADALAPFRLPAHALEAAFERASKIAGQFDCDQRTRADTFRHLVTRIVVAPDELKIQLDRKSVALMLRLPVDAQDTTLDLAVLKVRASLQRAGQSKRLVIGDQREPRIDAGLVALLHGGLPGSATGSGSV